MSSDQNIIDLAVKHGREMYQQGLQDAIQLVELAVGLGLDPLEALKRRAMKEKSDE